MSKKIVAIAGGENGRILEDGTYAPYETEIMDKEIIKITGKKTPNFLFLAHAFESLEIQESYYQTMKKIYKDMFGCNCCDLKRDELDNLSIVKEKIDWADIIYEGGGDTFSMISLWKKTGFDKILYQAWNDGKVMCGVSAGAVCWFKSCNSDSLIKDSFESVDCLGWLNAHFTPHCDELGRYQSTKEQLKNKESVGIMLSNGSAIEIIDDNYRIIANNNSYGLKCYYYQGEYFEEELDLSNQYKPLSTLLNKNSKIKYK